MARDRAGDPQQRGAGLTSLSDRFRTRPGGEDDPQDPQPVYTRETAEDARPPAPGPAAPEQRASSARPAGASVIDGNSTFDGRFETGQDLRVEGTVSGEIICRGALYIEKNAIARVKRVEAREVHVFGTLEGEIECSEKLVLAETANISGTIRAGTLVVHEGAILNGTVETGEAASADRSTRATPSRRNQRAESNGSSADKGKEPSFSLSAIDAPEEASPAS